MKTGKNALAILIVLLTGANQLLSSCAAKPTPASTANPTSIPTNVPTSSPEPTASPAPSISPTSSPTLLPLPALSLQPGDFYFSVDGQESFIFSRNIAGYQQVHYNTFLDWAKAGGTMVARLQLDSLGMGYTSTGGVNENWAVQWERIFDKAEADEIYILPVFTGWFDWNAGTGYSTWKNNPLNQVNGGPVQSPAELFQNGSATQTMWLQWMQTLVTRWQGRRNILGWEIFSEVNLASGATETSGIDFVNSAAALIRAADPFHRPVTASLADFGNWSRFYQSDGIDFINFHPYPVSGKLDSTIITETRALLARYDKPVLIGESGLSFENPDITPPTLTTALRADIGIKHAIWAAVVSGAMNGRGLYWEDSFGIYFPSLGIPWMQKYASEELPAANFVGGVDFAGFKPLPTTASSGVWGATVGNENMVLGWFRDASSEPPNWNNQPVISGQTVTITIPGARSGWQVDFYDTKTGTTIVSSASVSRQGSTITVSLPDFQDDIAFKMTAQEEISTETPAASANTDAIAGNWSGTFTNQTRTFSTQVKLSIQPGCTPGQACGTFSAPKLPCSGDLILNKITGDTFVFSEQNATGAALCTSGGVETLQLLADGSLSYQYSPAPGAGVMSSGILKRP